MIGARNNNDKAYVAFLDLLGFRCLLHGDTQLQKKRFESLDRCINEALEASLSGFEDLISVKPFSDCFCCSIPQEGDNLRHLLVFIGVFQYHLFRELHVFCRGGVASGVHYESETVIFSEALVKASELEKQALFPRTLISGDILTESDFDRNLAVRAPDGHLFVDYLAYPMSAMADEALSLHRAAIVKQVESNRNNPDILNKYWWLMQYHNAKFDQYYSPDEYYPEYIAKMSHDLRIDPKAVFPGFALGEKLFPWEFQ